MSNAIRLSPSGPVLSNSGGAPFQPGPGAQLRLVEAASTGTQTITATPGAPIAQGDGSTALVVSLAAPNPAKNYRATVVCEAENDSTNVTAVVQLYLETSPDNATWTEVAANGHLVTPGNVRQIRCDLPLSLGSDAGVTANQANLYLRCRVAKSVGAAITSSGAVPGADPLNKGATLLQLVECF